MKTRLWTLYRTLLNNHYGFSAAKFYYIKKRQRTWEPLVIVAGLTPAVVMGIVFIWNLTEQLFIGGSPSASPIWRCSTAPFWSLWRGFSSGFSRCSPLFTSAPTWRFCCPYP